MVGSLKQEPLQERSGVHLFGPLGIPHHNCVAFWWQEDVKILLTIYRIKGDPKFKDGTKLKFLILNDEGRNYVRVDKHDGPGYHHHPYLPLNENVRVSLEEQNEEGAKKFFIDKVREVTGEHITSKIFE